MLVRLPTLEAQVAAGATTAEIAYVWPRDGVVVAMALGVTSGLLVDRAGLEIAIYQRQSNFVADDFGREFVPACLLGAAREDAVDWKMLLLPVLAGETWIFQLRNVGPNPVTPQALFDVAFRNEMVSP